MKHVWHVRISRPQLTEWITCVYCGVILRADKANEQKDCQGKVKISLRDSHQNGRTAE